MSDALHGNETPLRKTSKNYQVSNQESQMRSAAVLGMSSSVTAMLNSGCQEMDVSSSSRTEAD